MTALLQGRRWKVVVQETVAVNKACCSFVEIQPAMRLLVRTMGRQTKMGWLAAKHAARAAANQIS